MASLDPHQFGHHKKLLTHCSLLCKMHSTTEFKTIHKFKRLSLLSLFMYAKPKHKPKFCMVVLFSAMSLPFYCTHLWAIYSLSLMKVHINQTKPYHSQAQTPYTNHHLTQPSPFHSADALPSTFFCSIIIFPLSFIWMKTQTNNPWLYFHPAKPNLIQTQNHSWNVNRTLQQIYYN